MLKIIADEAIPLPPGRPEIELRSLPAGEIQAAVVRDADALLVRSVTRVNAGLLQDSRVRFVATATAGIDHVDRDWLRARGIAFSAAPGCNAESVADWVTAAILHWSAPGNGPGQSKTKAAREHTLKEKSLGIVGFGHTGSAVYRRLAKLVGRLMVYDPFVDAPHAVDDCRELSTCDILTLHVPLTRTGQHPTESMIDESFLNARPPGSLLLNAARGRIVDEDALLKNIKRRDAPAKNGDPPGAGGIVAGIDAWQDEPRVNPELLAACFLGTPHIAGHTIQAKARGGLIVWNALLKFFELPASAPEAPTGQLALPGAADDAGTADEAPEKIIRRVFDLAAMSRRFKSELNAAADPARAFQVLRHEFGARNELAAYQLDDAGAPLQTLFGV